MKYEISPDACRICLRKSRSSRSIFKRYDDHDIPLSEKLKLISGVTVVEDEDDKTVLPQLICRSCEISLNMAFSLRARARKSDQIIHIYCNKMHKGNIIVELSTGRKFTLSKELTLKVVRGSAVGNAPLSSEDAEVIDSETQLNEICMDDDIKEHENLDEIEFENEYESFMDEEEHLDHDPNNISIETQERNHDDYRVEEDLMQSEIEIETPETTELEPKVAQLYNAEEIATRLKSCEKYEVVSWKQEDKKDSVPVFRLRLKEGGKKPTSNDFICEVCGNTYRQRHRLTEHMRRHNNERRFACEICNKRFSIAEGLRRHILTHGANKPYKCNYCARRFFNPSARKAHEIVHSGAKPYVCRVCNRAFAYTCSLRKHMLIHENKKLYRCDYCDKEFRLHHHLKQHEDTQIHKDAVTEYENLESYEAEVASAH